jgi:hypothetical protein
MGNKKENKDRFEITEMFMATKGGDYSRCFHGTIQRLTDEDGSDYCFGKIKVNQGWVCARGSNQDELGRKLDELVLMVLDYGLHSNAAKTIKIGDNDYFLN